MNQGSSQQTSNYDRDNVCERIYRIDVGICGWKFKIGCIWPPNPLKAVFNWIICMHKARVEHIKCLEDCVDKDFGEGKK